MDFAALPPEINSGRMYAGPGAGSLQAAAAAWGGLATELRSIAASYSSAVSGVTAAWTGPAAASMAAAAAPYVAWLTTTATQAEQTASQARAAAVAYETAFAAMVPPPVIAANRAQLASLHSSNILGQNTAAIAATEAQYAGMWAQDSAAMYSYAGQSAAAAAVTPFTPPPQSTNPAGTAAQGAAVAQSVGSSAATNTQSVLSQLTSTTPGALQSLASPVAASSPLSALSDLVNSINSSPLASLAAGVELLPKSILPANDIIISIIMGLVVGGRHLSDVAVGAAASGAGAAAPALGSGLVGAGSAVSASVGNSGFVGALATPPSWAAATPAIRTVAAVLSAGGESAVAAAAVSQGSLFSGMAVAGMAAGALGSAIPRALTGGAPKGGGVATKDVKELKDSTSSPTLQRIVAEMAEKPESVQHWHTDSENLDTLLAELQQKPGIHAVHVSKNDKPTMTPPKSQLL